ncbi:CD276 antigen isoform X5 [Manis pentadactyla]|uniref:CD276 antigen isoform X5 n=1 Tax=Manis pentadactyla TaxID=143292 RepID=UPI00255CCE54|nr:CD276 antigen isoform X5 [Manis pentadactyla]
MGSDQPSAAFPQLAVLPARIWPEVRGGVRPTPCPAGGLRPWPPNRCRGANPALGAHREAFPGPRLPPARPAPQTPGAAPDPSRPASRGGSAPLRPCSREAARRGAAGAAFHHGEPSRQRPHRRMLCPGSMGVGMGVRVAIALGALWFCLTAPYSKPSMTLEPSKDLRPGDTVTITCSSHRGYPEAEVSWQDGQGAPLTGNVTTSQMANEQGLFDVRSVLRVVLGANGTYSCLVRNPVLQQDAHGSVTVSSHRSPTGAVEVQVPEDPVVALVGTDATLRCSFSPEPDFSLAQLNLIWQLTDTKQLVHSFAEGRDQGSAYANRTALFTDLLAQGNASLRLQRVRVADEGSFTCFVSIRDFGSAAVSLQVAAPYSKPSMTLEPSKDLRPGDTVTITCSSHRGYPEAEVSWQDGQGAPLTGNVTTSQMANEQGLFDVRSVLRVVLGANGTYSCLVRNPVLQQDAHGSVTITGQPMTFPPEALWVTVGLSVCLVALLVALAFVCWRKIKQSCEEENAGADDQDGDGEGSKTALRPLKHSESKEDDGQEIA